MMANWTFMCMLLCPCFVYAVADSACSMMDDLSNFSVEKIVGWDEKIAPEIGTIFKVLACVNVAGGEIPPMVIVKGKTRLQYHRGCISGRLHVPGTSVDGDVIDMARRIVYFISKS